MTAVQTTTTPRKTLPRGDRPIVFFDGECVMCNTFVDLMLQLDPKAKIRLAPLQGTTAKQFLPPLPEERKEWTIYYLDSNDLFDRSEAIIQICQRLGGWVTPIGWGSVVARPVRDQLYTLIARNRYSLFGKRKTCRTSAPEEQNRFLP